MKPLIYSLLIDLILILCSTENKAQSVTDKKINDSLEIITLKNDAELYLKYSYTETKQLGTQFLTLVSAVLVFSLSFSEKVFNFSNTSKKKKLIMILAWSLFLVGIISCGLGLVCNAVAGGQHVIFLHPQFKLDDIDLNETYNSIQKFTNLTYLLVVVAGGCFIIGLLFLILAAIKSNHTTWKKKYY